MCGKKEESSHNHEHYCLFDSAINEEYKKSSIYNPAYEVGSCACGYSTLFFNPITDEAKAKADAKEYTFDPESVLIKEKESYDFTATELNNLNEDIAREGHNIVYYFGGEYKEGITYYYGNIYLYDDGLYYGKIGDQVIKGYWFNSSSQNQTEGTKDCLTMLNNIEKYELIDSTFVEVNNDSTIIYVYLKTRNGQRAMTMRGDYYYPETSIELYLGYDAPIFYSGKHFSKESLDVVTIDKKLIARSILNPEEYSVVFPVGFIDNNGILGEPGEYEIKVTYKDLEVSRKVVINKNPFQN